ncbi:hypothetical protein V496_03795 [Pseudogymnoascus sp. VKM F-4515 (FW-2607)]|nr:hypothetical protein V496_03795 [Pseudogymnoascus sp. VKM F-4515 (FW-2607)]KFY82391.1 hypothetical protein V498_08610 [Pseudogymnoascus sp. VKM F-4517 (FW-2822)]
MTSTTDNIQGACNCGAIGIKIEASSFPAMAGLCHCFNCQASGGSLFSYNLPTPTKAIEITGTPKIFTETTGKGTTANRHFCGDCGSPIMTVIAERPESAYVKGGIFRKFGVELPKPVAQIFMNNKLSWEEPLSGAMEIDLDVE